jgi:glycerol-3-phosphate dehydrogenase
VLARRTRLAIEIADRGLEAAPHAAALMAAELGGDAARVDREITQYRQAVAAERDAQDQPDDELAFQARRRVADPVSFYDTEPPPSPGSDGRAARRAVEP